MNTTIEKQIDLPVGICLVTGEKVGILSYKYCRLKTTEGRKLFRVWLKPEYTILQGHALRSLIQSVLGEKINLKSL